MEIIDSGLLWKNMKSRLADYSPSGKGIVPSFEQDKAKLQEDLQAVNHHLINTETAFNDVHQKYERLKGVVSVYKNNEAVLKESIQENVETIKTLETRYDQLKEHAMAQLEKYAIITYRYRCLCIFLEKTYVAHTLIYFNIF